MACLGTRGGGSVWSCTGSHRSSPFYKFKVEAERERVAVGLNNFGGTGNVLQEIDHEIGTCYGFNWWLQSLKLSYS